MIQKKDSKDLPEKKTKLAKKRETAGNNQGKEGGH